MQLQSYKDVRQCLNGGVECRRSTVGAFESALTKGGQWRETRAERMFGLYDSQVKIFEYVGDQSSGKIRP